MGDGDGGTGLDGLSSAARSAVAAAAREADVLGTARVGTEHLLLGLIAVGAGAATVLRDAGVSAASARRKVAETHQRSAGAGDGIVGGAAGLPRRSPRAERALNRAFRFANDHRSPVVRSEHLLLGVLDVEGTAGQVLRGLGTDVDAVRTALLAVDLAVPEPEPEGPLEPIESTGGAAAPRCSGCGANVAALVVTVVPAGDGEAVVHSCPTCGVVLGATSA